MGKTHTVTGYDNIILQFPYEIKTLLELKIIQSINEHGRIYFTGIVPEEKKDDYIKMASSNDKIKVKNKDEILFKGKVSNIKIKAVNKVYYIEVEGVSQTYDLDIKLKSKSFQDQNMLYTGLIQNVISTYSGSDFIDTAAKGKKIEKLIVQYNETDWDFLKRMASHFNTVLVPDAASSSPKFWFGMPQGKNGGVLDDFHYSIKRDISSFLNSSKNNGQEGNEDDFTYYEVESTKVLNLGDKIKVKGKILIISSIKAVMKDGILKYQYTLYPEKGIYQGIVLNESISGASIEGKVIDISKDTVKVHLNIDKEQIKEKAISFPYASHYTVEGSTGWYCMPKVGDAVNLYFPSNKEEKAVVISSIRKEQTGQTQDPSTKYLSTSHGKEMKLSPGEITFTAMASKKGKIFINLNEKEGIEIHSLEPIKLTSKKDMTFDADKKIQIKAKENIYFVCNTNSILMDGITYLRGTKVKMEGSQK